MRFLHRTRLEQPSRMLAFVGWLLIVTLLAGTGLAAMARHDDQREDARRETASLALATAVETARVLRSADLVLQSVGLEIAASRPATAAEAAARMATQAVHETLRRRLIGLPHIDSIGLVSADGTIVNSSRRWPTPILNTAGREHIQALIDDPALRRYISAPDDDLVDGIVAVVLVQRIDDADGRLLGFAVATVEIEGLIQFAAGSGEHRGLAMALLRQDGRLLARVPSFDGATADPASGARAFEVLGSRSAATVDGDLLTGSTAGVMSLRAVPEFGVAVAVTRPPRDMVAGWNRETALLISTALVVAAVLSITVLLMRNRVLRQEETENALRVSDLRHRAVVDSLKEVVFQADDEGRWIFLNPAWTEITGIAVADSLGRHVTDYVHPDDRQRTVELFQPLIRRETEYCRHEIRCLTADGGFRWVEVFARLTVDGAGQVSGIAGTLNDVTERRRAADALRASEAHLAEKSAVLEATLEHMSQGIMLIDADGTVPVCNRRAIEMLDLPPKMMSMRPTFDDIINWQWRAGEFVNAQEALRRFVGSGGLLLDRPQVYERRRPNGQVIEVNSVPLASGGVVRTFTDITAFRTAEAELRKAKEEAEHSSKVRSAFLATMSHEIRTPLNGVVGITDLLLDTPLDETQRRYANALRQSADHLLQVIDDVLDFSKLDVNRLRIEETVFDLEDLVRSVVDMLKPKAESKGIALNWSIDPALPRHLVGDPGRIRQILINIAGNGVKFTSQGEVAVRLNNRTPGPTRDSVHLQAEVSDTGIGIPADALPELFREFNQLDGSITRRFGGTGLGLAISKRLATLMGGTIAVESKPGCGSTFRIDMRLKCAEAADEIVPGAAGLPAETASVDGTAEALPAGLHILLAEDNQTNQLVAAKMLEKLGCMVTTVGDGDEAVQAVQRQRYDIVLMDVMMPKMDGLAATRAIRALPDGDGRLPIVALTANAFIKDRAACLDAGMSGFIAKPVTPAKLTAAIAEALAAPPGVPAAPASDSTAAAGGARGAIDEAALQELAEAFGDTCSRFLGLFLSETEARLERISRLIAAADTAAVAIEAHTMKGASMTFGCNELRRLAADLEAAAEAAESERLKPLLTASSVAFDTVRADLLRRFPAVA